MIHATTRFYGNPGGPGINGEIRLVKGPKSWVDALCFRCQLDDCPSADVVKADGCRREYALVGLRLIAGFCRGMEG